MPRKAAKDKPKVKAKPKGKAKAVKAPVTDAPAPRTPKVPNPLGEYIGSIVRYYDEGWRHGYLEKTEGPNAVRIRPCGGIYDTVLRSHKYPNTDVVVEEVR